MNEIFEYSHSPKANLTKSVILVILCFLSGILLGIASTEEFVLSPYLKCGSGFFFLLGIVFFVRFIGTRYVYRITIDRRGNGDLTIFELHGYFGKYADAKSSKTVCRVSLYEIKEIYTLTNDKEGKKEIKKLKKQLKDEKNEIYSYCHEIFPKQYTLLKLDDGESVSYLKFTPNPKMLKIIEK